jgi:hypothetical protein
MLAKFYKILSLSLLLLFLLCSVGLSAASNPNWFTIILQQWDNYWNNTINLNDVKSAYLDSFNTFGQLQSRPRVWTNPPFPEWEVLTVEVSIPGGQMRLYKVGDTSQWFNYTLQLREVRTADPMERLHYPSLFPYTFDIQSGLVASTTTVFSINIEAQHGGGNARFGTYTTQIVFRVYDKEHALLAEKNYNFIVYNKFKDGGVVPSSTLAIEQYLTASNIDIEYLQQHSNEKLAVGAVTFVSNEPFGMYRLNFSPYPNPNVPFSFVNESASSSIIVYKVVNPLDSSISHTHQFDLALPYVPYGTGWRDRLEIAIRNANYTNLTPRAGIYRSVIQIELRSN